MENKYAMVIDENLAQELLANDCQLIYHDTSKNIWIFEYSEEKFKCNSSFEEYSNKFYISNTFSMTF